jgi:hypothetical protein
VIAQPLASPTLPPLLHKKIDLPPERLPAALPPAAPKPTAAPVTQTNAVRSVASPKIFVITPSAKAASQYSAQVLTGSVESWHKTWRLRYAPLDVEEPNGGRVTLVGAPELDRLEVGQRLRVRGILAPATDRAHPPTFHVQSMEMVE